MDKNELREIIEKKTHRSDKDIIRSDVDTASKNLKDKLSRVSGEKAKEIGRWFEETQTTITLKDLD